MRDGMEKISVIKDMILAFAGAFTAYAACYGVTTWRRELMGRTEYEQARRLIRSVYKTRDSFWSLRNPFISGGEFPEEYWQTMGEESPDKKFRAHSYIYENRLKPFREAFQELEAESLEGEVIWGGEIEDQMKKFRQCRSIYMHSLQMYLESIRSGRDLTSESEREFRRNVSAPPTSDDRLSIKFREAVVGLEAIVRPHLGRRQLTTQRTGRGVQWWFSKRRGGSGAGPS